jgi:hypothetical protein
VSKRFHDWLAGSVPRLYFIYPFRLDNRIWYTIWYTSLEFDGFCLDENGIVPTFRLQKSARAFARDKGFHIESESVSVSDFDSISSWLQKPTSETVDCEAFLLAWNNLTDIESAINKRNMDVEDRASLGIYEKLFAGCNMPMMVAQGEKYLPSWSNSELVELQTILSSKLARFKSRLNLQQMDPP